MILSPYMKEKYPYLYKQSVQQDIDDMVFMAQYELSKFIEDKKQELGTYVNDIERRLNQISIDVETTINNQPMSNANINKEIKKMALQQIREALR